MSSIGSVKKGHKARFVLKEASKSRFLLFLGLILTTLNAPAQQVEGSKNKKDFITSYTWFLESGLVAMNFDDVENIYIFSLKIRFDERLQKPTFSYFLNAPGFLRNDSTGLKLLKLDYIKDLLSQQEHSQSKTVIIPFVVYFKNNKPQVLTEEQLITLKSLFQYERNQSEPKDVTLAETVVIYAGRPQH